MSRLAQLGRRTPGFRAFAGRSGRTGAATGALALALALMLSPTPQALAQSAGIYINNDVLNSLGPGPAAAPPAPLAPAAPPTLTAPSALPVQPLAPQPQNGNSLTFQTYGSGNYVVTRPGTLLFPPLEPPTSTLAPGLTDNHAARAEAMSNAFAEGPEPTSQLLIPLQPDSGSDSVVVFMDNLPSADPEADAGSAPVLTLTRPGLATPAPAPRKPEVSAEMLAETGATTIDDTSVDLAPEFQAEAAEAVEVAVMAPAQPAAEMQAAPAEPAEDPTETVVAETPAADIPPAEEAPQAQAEEALPAPLEPPAVAMTPPAAEPEAAPAAPAPAAMPEAMARAEPEMTAEALPAAEGETGAPVSLVPTAGTPASQEAAVRADAPLPSAKVPAPVTQTAALPQDPDTADMTDAAVNDMSFLFETDSAELSSSAQNELRGLAQAMRTRDDGRIQVLGFASAQDGSDDLARRLALSRALKVRTFLIDAGVPSARIQVRSLGTQSDGGPANRVDIRPIDS